MTTTLDRPEPKVQSRPTPAVPRVAAPGPERDPSRFRSWLRRHGASLAWMLPVLAIAGLIQRINMTGSPQRIDDEGTYTAQAWAIDKLGELTHYTYWYDHPPLGWIQIAGYAKLTGAFERYDVAVMAGREAMLFFTVVAAALLFVLVRRLSFSRPAAAASVLLFAVSPLAIQYHRSVYLDNIAAMWLIGAFLLATTRKWQLAGFVGSAAAFGIAVLSKETFLLALPFLAWVMFRNSFRETRRYTLAVAGTVLFLIGFGYIMLAITKSELFPSPNHVSLINGITFQLGSRQASGSPFDPDSLISRNFAQWWQLDRVGIVLGSIAGVAGLFVKRIRPFAAFLVFSILFMFRPGGYTPVPYVIVMIPFAALCIAGVTDAVIKNAIRRGALRKVAAVAWSALVIVAVVAASPLWFTQLRGFLQADQDGPSRQAVEWVDQYVPESSRLLVDDSMWVDLVNAGFARDNVIWYYKIGQDAQVDAQSPNGWKDSDYIITTDSMRTFQGTYKQVSNAIANSTEVAHFGSGTQEVDVRRIDPQGTADLKRTVAANSAVDQAAGVDLAENPTVKLTSGADEKLRGGAVDSRVSVAIGALASTGGVTVGSFPSIDGEYGPVSRQVLVTELAGESTKGDTSAARSVRQIVTPAAGFFFPESVKTTADGVLITFPLDPTRSVAG